MMMMTCRQTNVKRTPPLQRTKPKKWRKKRKSQSELLLRNKMCSSKVVQRLSGRWVFDVMVLLSSFLGLPATPDIEKVVGLTTTDGRPSGASSWPLYDFDIQDDNDTQPPPQLPHTEPRLSTVVGLSPQPNFIPNYPFRGDPGANMSMLGSRPGAEPRLSTVGELSPEPWFIPNYPLRGDPGANMSMLGSRPRAPFSSSSSTTLYPPSPSYFLPSNPAERTQSLRTEEEKKEESSNNNVFGSSFSHFPSSMQPPWLSGNQQNTFAAAATSPTRPPLLRQQSRLSHFNPSAAASGAASSSSSTGRAAFSRTQEVTAALRSHRRSSTSTQSSPTTTLPGPHDQISQSLSKHSSALFPYNTPPFIDTRASHHHHHSMGEKKTALTPRKDDAAARQEQSKKSGKRPRMEATNTTGQLSRAAATGQSTIFSERRERIKPCGASSTSTSSCFLKHPRFSQGSSSPPTKRKLIASSTSGTTGETSRTTTTTTTTTVTRTREESGGNGGAFTPLSAHIDPNLTPDYLPFELPDGSVYFRPGTIGAFLVGAEVAEKIFGTILENRHSKVVRKLVQVIASSSDCNWKGELYKSIYPLLGGQQNQTLEETPFRFFIFSFRLQSSTMIPAVHALAVGLLLDPKNAQELARNVANMTSSDLNSITLAEKTALLLSRFYKAVRLLNARSGLAAIFAENRTTNRVGLVNANTRASRHMHNFIKIVESTGDFNEAVVKLRSQYGKPMNTKPIKATKDNSGNPSTTIRVSSDIENLYIMPLQNFREDSNNAAAGPTVVGGFSAFLSGLHMMPDDVDDYSELIEILDAAHSYRRRCP